MKFYRCLCRDNVSIALKFKGISFFPWRRVVRMDRVQSTHLIRQTILGHRGVFVDLHRQTRLITQPLSHGSDFHSNPFNLLTIHKLVSLLLHIECRHKKRMTTRYTPRNVEHRKMWTTLFNVVVSSQGWYLISEIYTITIAAGCPGTGARLAAFHVFRLN